MADFNVQDTNGVLNLGETFGDILALFDDDEHKSECNDDDLGAYCGMMLGEQNTLEDGSDQLNLAFDEEYGVDFVDKVDEMSPGEELLHSHCLLDERESNLILLYDCYLLTTAVHSLYLEYMYYVFCYSPDDECFRENEVRSNDARNFE